MPRREKRRTLSYVIFRVFLWIVTKINPDLSHRLMVWGLRDGSFPTKTHFDPVLAVSLWGKQFKNPVGIAAGVDKRGNVIDKLIDIGWGFGEFGSYTLEAEYPAKTTYYLKKDKAILMQSTGYRNPGVSAIVPVLAARRHLPAIVGVNVATTAQNEKANIKQGALMSYEDEFAIMAAKVAPYCDYVVLNLTHPECELYGLFSEKSIMLPLIRTVREAIQKAAPLSTPKLLLKVPLNLSELEIPLAIQMMEEAGIDGVIVGGVMNLAKQSKDVLQEKKGFHIGMLAGQPLYKYTRHLVEQVYLRTNGRIPIIAAGGISTGLEAFEMIKAGASLVQVNTALIFKGPEVVNEMNAELARLLKKNGFKSVQEAVGSAYL